MTESLFARSPLNPILTPSGRWWEARAVLNPGAAVHDGRVALVYRAVGVDGISRFGLAWSGDGQRIDEREPLPFYEASPNDPTARLGVEDPRLTPFDAKTYLTYCKASVESASTLPLSWEPAPFRVRTGLAETDDFTSAREIGRILPDRNTKDAVLFPRKIDGSYAALIREYPSIQFVTSPDLLQWSDPVEVMSPVPGTWQGERIGPGPPPIEIPWGWLLLYHGNEYLHLPDNRRRYSMGLALLDLRNPSQVLYRHRDPIFWPEAPYEVEGPVGNVVFCTGLVEMDGRYYLYYGAGDGVIGVATVSREALYAFLQGVVSRASQT